MLRIVMMFLSCCFFFGGAYAADEGVRPGRNQADARLVEGFSAVVAIAPALAHKIKDRVIDTSLYQDNAVKLTIFQQCYESSCELEKALYGVGNVSCLTDEDRINLVKALKKVDYNKRYIEALCRIYGFDSPQENQSDASGEDGIFF